MTTTPRKTGIYKKARAISSGFLVLINTFVLTPRQGIAGRRISFKLRMKHHTDDHSTTVCSIASIQTYESIQVWLRGVEDLQVAKRDSPTSPWPINRWRAE